MPTSSRRSHCSWLLAAAPTPPCSSPAARSRPSSAAGANPSPAFDVPNFTHLVETDAPGRLFVYGKATLTIQCSAGVPRTALYVDGVAVPGTGYSYGTGTATYVSTAGVSQPVPAGNHSVQLGTDCDGGNWLNTIINHASVSSVLLGGS
jgi:hypothetical protein